MFDWSSVAEKTRESYAQHGAFHLCVYLRLYAVALTKTWDFLCSMVFSLAHHDDYLLTDQHSFPRWMRWSVVLLEKLHLITSMKQSFVGLWEYPFQFKYAILMKCPCFVDCRVIFFLTYICFDNSIAVIVTLSNLTYLFRSKLLRSCRLSNCMENAALASALVIGRK